MNDSAVVFEERVVYTGIAAQGIVELSEREIGEVRGGWLPVVGLVLGVAGRAGGGWVAAYANRAAFGLGVYEAAKWWGKGSIP